MKSPKIILASNSPRRKELLSKIISEDNFIVLGSNIAEKILKGEDAEIYCLRIAEAKARSVMRRHKKTTRGALVVIGADTVILLNKEIIGQPKDLTHAQKMLEKLSGKKHEVLTGVCLILVREKWVIKFAVKSQVWMKKLDAKRISDYIKTNEPMGKAGAYAIQGLGRKIIKKYEGSYTNIIGLPVKELRDILSCMFRIRTIGS